MVQSHSKTYISTAPRSSVEFKFAFYFFKWWYWNLTCFMEECLNFLDRREKQRFGHGRQNIIITVYKFVMNFVVACFIFYLLYSLMRNEYGQECVSLESDKWPLISIYWGFFGDSNTMWLFVYKKNCALKLWNCCVYSWKGMENLLKFGRKNLIL